MTGVDSDGVKGDVSLFNQDGNTMIQIEGLILKSVPQPDTGSERGLFSHVVWESDPSGYSSISLYPEPEENMMWLNAAEIVALYSF